MTAIGTLPLLHTEPVSENILWSPGFDSEESILPGWESITGLLKRSTNTGSDYSSRKISLAPPLIEFCFLEVDNLIIIPVSNSPHTGTLCILNKYRRIEDREQDIYMTSASKEKSGQLIKSDSKA